MSTTGGPPAPQKKTKGEWIRWGVLVSVILVSGFYSLYRTSGKIEDVFGRIGEAPQFQSVSIDPEASDKATQFNQLIALERLAIETRNHRAREAVSGRILLSVNAAIFGGIMVVFGSIFIVSRIETSVSDLSADAAAFKVQLISSSPGIIFAGLGLLALAVPYFLASQVQVSEGAIYVSGVKGSATVSTDLVNPVEAEMEGAYQSFLDNMKEQKDES